MEIKTIISLYKKELTDILRDKKTIIMMIVLPILLYPLLMIGGVKLGTFISSSNEKHVYSVALDINEDLNKEELKNYLNNNSDYSFEFVDTDEYISKLKNEQIDCFISGEETSDGRILYKINYNSSISNSSNGERALSEVLKKYNTSLSKDIVKDAGLNEDKTLNPIEIERQNYSSSQQSIGNILGMVIPLLLIVSILMGAIYPAIDVTAGERERGTLETILTLPVSNKELIFSKFFAVATISIISAVANLLSMSMVGIYMYNTMKSMMPSVQVVEINIVNFVPALIIVFLCVITFALFITALAMSVCIFAKTFKEAQNFITPFMLVLMMLSYVSFMPNVSLTKAMAAIPVVNLTLLVKDIMLFKFDITILLIVLLSNVLYSLITVTYLSKIYNSESILFGSTRYDFKLFERRANIKKGGMPSIQDSIFILGIGLLLIIYVGSYFQLKYGLYGVLSNQVILLLLVFAYLVYTKCDIKKTMNIRKPKVSSIIGAILLWIGTFIIITLISIPLQKLFPDSAENLNTINNLLGGYNILELLVIMAVVPAVCEELFFRGFIFSAAREKFKIVPAIIFVSVIFGIYHMSLIKIFTVGILGAAFAISIYYSKSIVTSMIMHFLNNSIAVIVFEYGDILMQKLPFLFLSDITLLKIIIYCIFSIIFAFSGIILLRGKNTRSC